MFARIGRITIFALVALACNRPGAPSSKDTARPLASVPVYLQPIFASLDTLLTRQQRDSLRVLPLDSGFRFRAWELAEIVKPRWPEWVRMPLGDSIIAHGEQGYMLTTVVLDLYHQHLRGQVPSLADALHRVSQDYVDSLLKVVSVDSVLLRQDLDGSGIPDQIVREAQRPIDTDGKDRNSSDSMDTIGMSQYRVALYLDTIPLKSPPAWASLFVEKGDAGLVKTISLREGATLLLFGVSGADADVQVVVLAQRGEAREILRHQIDYGEGDFSLRETEGRIVADLTGDVQLGERSASPDITCPPTAWAGLSLVYDGTTRRFAVRRSICMTRQY